MYDDTPTDPAEALDLELRFSEEWPGSSAEAIYDAIAAQNPAKASQAARRHMEKSFERYSAIARVVAE